jgi:Family of unknown function (DUF6266)
MKSINPIMQGASGKLGNVIFRDGGNGTVIGAAYQPNVKNPRTEAQQGNRNKMAAIGRLSKAMAPLLRFAFLATQRAGRPTVHPHNQFVKDNIGVVDITGIIRYKDLQVSKGGLQMIEQPVITSNPFLTPLTPENHDIEFDFTFNANALNASPTDEVYLVSINPESMEVVLTKTQARSTGQCKSRTGRNPKTGQPIEYYAFIMNPITKRVSDSFYIGTVDRAGTVSYLF